VSFEKIKELNKVAKGLPQLIESINKKKKR